MEPYLMINDIFDRIIYEQIEDNKLINLYLFNNNFQLLQQNVQFSHDSDNGIKVIKYNNLSTFEGGGGASYMVTDPSVFHVTSPFLSKNLLDFGNVVKYGAILNDK